MVILGVSRGFMNALKVKFNRLAMFWEVLQKSHFFL